jgi:hypothetical protein
MLEAPHGLLACAHVVTGQDFSRQPLPIEVAESLLLGGPSAAVAGQSAMCGTQAVNAVCDGLQSSANVPVNATSSSSMLYDGSSASRQLPAPFEDINDRLEVVAQTSSWLQEYVALGKVLQWFTDNAQQLMQ